MATPDILIQAVVSEGEQPAVRKAAALISESLSAVSAEPWVVDCRFPPTFDGLDRSCESVVVTSFLGEVDRIDEAWAEAERRLRSQYEDLCAAGHLVVFVCTVLRHVSADTPPEIALARKVRIRRLNLLAAELSQEFGLLVIDLDRDLADIGARVLGTDYRLLGQYAPDAAGKSIAMSLLLVGLDAFTPVDVQQKARDWVSAYQPSRGSPALSKLRVTGGQAVAVRVGRRSQVIESALDAVDENFVALYVKRVLNGQITVPDAFGIMSREIRRRGLRSSMARLTAGLRRMAGESKLAKR